MKSNSQNVPGAPRQIRITKFQERLFNVRIKYAPAPETRSVNKKISLRHCSSSLSSIHSYHQNYFIVSYFNGKKSLFYG